MYNLDTLWVENLNTALDDSKILCLANGERISLNSQIRLLFEVDDLSRSSPATISRCAMVYMVRPTMIFGYIKVSKARQNTRNAKILKQLLLMSPKGNDSLPLGTYSKVSYNNCTVSTGKDTFSIKLWNVWDSSFGVGKLVKYGLSVFTRETTPILRYVL